MQNTAYEPYDDDTPPFLTRVRSVFDRPRMSRHVVIATILVVALFAFEIFNFDTTRYALASLIGENSFVGVTWASVLAIAFCSIDFAGLARIFTRQDGNSQQKESLYLMGAWVLGAMMNAIMTWWAVSLVLLSHNNFGNEVLDRETLLRVVPIFVAMLVFLTRILFIGSLTITGEKLMAMHYRGRDDDDARANISTRRAVSSVAAVPYREQQQSLQIRERRRTQTDTQRLTVQSQPLPLPPLQAKKPATRKKPPSVKKKAVPKRSTTKPRTGLGTTTRERSG